MYSRLVVSLVALGALLGPFVTTPAIAQTAFGSASVASGSETAPEDAARGEQAHGTPLPAAATPALDDRTRDLLAIAALVCLLLAGVLLNARRVRPAERMPPPEPSERPR